MSRTASALADRVGPKVARLLFAFFACLYLLTNSGRLTTSDGIAMFEVTRSIVERQDFAIPSSAQGSRGTDGRYFSRYGLMPSLIAIPLYVAGKVGGATLLRRINPDWITKFAVTLLNPLITAATCVILFALAGSLGFPVNVSLGLAFVYGLCTFAWNYTQVFFSEPIAGFFLLLAVLFAVRFRSSFRPGDAAGCGLSMGAMILTKPVSVCIVPVLLIAMLWNCRNSTRSVFVVCAPIAAAFAVIAWYNWIRFGSPLKTGYPEEGRFFANPLWIGLRGYLFSMDRNLFLFNPVLLAALFAFPLFFRERREAAMIISAISVIWLVIHAKFPGWHGGGCWGPRYLLPLTGLVLLPGCLWLARWNRLSAATRVALVLLGTVSMLVQILSISVSYQRHQIKLAITTPPQDTLQDRWLWSPIAGQVTGLMEVLREEKPKGVLHGFQDRMRASTDRAHIREFKSKTHAEVFEESIEMHSLNFWFVYLRAAGFPITPLIAAVAVLLAGTGTSLVYLLKTRVN